MGSSEDGESIEFVKLKPVETCPESISTGKGLTLGSASAVTLGLLLGGIKTDADDP